MKKYLVTIEFRYKTAPKFEGDITSKNKTITIGIYDEFDEACIVGNNLLEILEKRFELHTFPNGTKASRERFSVNGGCFGSKNTLVSNLAYLRTPFSFYAKITTLKINPIESEIDNVLQSIKNYNIFLKDENN